MKDKAIHKQNLLYAGKIKSLYTTDQEDLLILQFRDDITAFNGIKHEVLPGKGAVNNYINAMLMSVLNTAGIPTHFKGILSENESVVTKLNMLPIKVIIHNIAAGNFCRHLGINVGRRFSPPLYEIILKSDELRDPLVSEYHAISLGWATKAQLDQMSTLTFKINQILFEFFSACSLIFVDAKLEFGIYNDKLYLADEITPDTCRIWDSVTHETFDKDRFRQDLGGVVTSYQQVATLLTQNFKGEIPKWS